MEDYKKKYEEALERARKINSGEGVAAPSDYTICETIFPELKDSEDERIRKGLIHYFKEQDGILTAISGNVSTKDVLAWLEKQCEQKPADKVEPKFKVGDSTKTVNEEPLTITKITDNGYWSEDLFICSFGNADKWELVEQKPTWSEEDERIYQSIIDDTVQETQLDIKQIKWLKSIKERMKGE